MTVMKHIVITGASGAIGAALAQAYAGPNVKLWLQGRTRVALDLVNQACRALGAQTEVVELDLTDLTAVTEWGKTLADAGVDLLVANAGMNIHVDSATGLENPTDSQRLLQLNLVSAIALVQAIAPAMQQRRSGQIALIASLAGWRGLPATPSYSASKAGLKAYGEGLRSALAPHGVSVNVVLPGYVQSPMCDDMPGPKPFLWTPERAAKAIQAGLSANCGRIAFPFWLSLGCQLLSVLPDGMATWILNRMGYGVKDVAHRSNPTIAKNTNTADGARNTEGDKR